MRIQLCSIAFLLIPFGLTGCETPGRSNNAARTPVAQAYQATATELALADTQYRGEWKSGFLYEIQFNGAGPTMNAEVHVIDSDDAKTDYRMPATVEIDGTNVTLNFTKLDRVDHLVFESSGSRLTGYTEFKGEKKESYLWAEKVAG